MTQASEFAGQSFTADDRAIEHFAERILKHIPRDRPLRVLDIGCGGGLLLFCLSEKIQGRFTGIDISAVNIASAKNHAAALSGKERFDFVQKDFLCWTPGIYDVIVSRSTLQHLEASPETVFGKIASSLVKDGIFINNMPCDSVCNRILYTFRKILIKMRSPALDYCILSASKALHGRRMSQTLLKERLFYMYTLPFHLEGKKLRDILGGLGLQQTASYDETRRSPGHPRHRTVVFVKRNAA